MKQSDEKKMIKISIDLQLESLEEGGDLNKPVFFLTKRANRVFKVIFFFKDAKQKRLAISTERNKMKRKRSTLLTYRHQIGVGEAKI